ncbi:MAG: site-specific integrase [Alicyclobacillus macrosporangiidus]|nr:site-specific integrase [Alicyclobacillus macrosporangiidus]
MNALKTERMRAAILLDLATGLRRGELLALEWPDIDFAAGTLRVNKQLVRIAVFESRVRSGTKLEIIRPKTKCSNRIVPLNDAILNILKWHKQEQNMEKNRAGNAYTDMNLVFCTELGNFYEPRNFLRLVYTLCKRAGIDRINVHTLRHTFATRMLEAGEAAKIVQEILGHEDITTTLNRYTHVLPDTKKKSVQKLNFLFHQL